MIVVVRILISACLKEQMQMENYVLEAVLENAVIHRECVWDIIYRMGASPILYALKGRLATPRNCVLEFVQSIVRLAM